MENLPTERISILILAGGTSSRMGRDKALISINGVVMLERICLVATECSNSVQVVTPWPERYQHIVPQDCGFLPELGGDGPLVAFAQSLPLVETEWVLLLACDLPLLLGKDIREWIGYLEVVKEEVVALVPRSEKGWEPLCGFYRRRCLPSLTDFIAKGGRSFQGWLKLDPVVELPIRDASVLFNCNTPEDLDILVTADDCEALRKLCVSNRPWRPLINADEMNTDELVVKLTEDGSFTFFSPEFQENFHSHSGAKQEAEQKFVLPCGLEQLAQQKNSLQILDICYGLGYNSAAALATIWKVNPHIQIQLIALELEPRVCQKARASQLLELWQQPIPQLLARLAVEQEVKESHLQAKLFWGDGRVTIKQVIGLNFQADAIFLDPFSPQKCPQLWTVEFLSLVAICLKPTGILATYSCAAAVRVALQLAGLTVGASKSVGRRSPGTVANKTGADLPPLSLQEREHLQTRAAIPYRDPMLKDSPEIILRRRQNSQLASLLETTKAWKKRWCK